MKDTPLILLVEDDDIDAFIVHTMLLKFCGNCNIIRLKNGAEATDYFKNNTNQRPSIVLLDLIMPRMDGKEFLSEMQKDGELSKLPIVILSSSSSFCDMQECEDKGVLKYFVKPLTPDISKEIIHLASVA
ncbi:response regulator [Fulvivirga imtechensis AK7]|uniref:Response regulator n=1 Tax=Fulvivirga imtechensis AK7 TaxID=1237149 RepID=L8JP43_9BACT|nr:response regulator [Fulvivirga imtechensis]ELR69254.1 response regulator [Fulvivirga imtechensis AK7]